MTAFESYRMNELKSICVLEIYNVQTSYYYKYMWLMIS